MGTHINSSSSDPVFNNPLRLDSVNDSVTAKQVGADSKVAITASAQIGSGPGKLKGFSIVSFTTGATVRFSDALTATTPYVSSATTLVFDAVTKTGLVAGNYVMIAQDGLNMATGCYCTITGTCEIIPDFESVP